MGIIDIHSDIIHHLVEERKKGNKGVLDSYHYPILKEAGVSTLVMPLWVEKEYQKNLGFARLIELLCGFGAEIQESKYFQVVQTIEDILEPGDKIPIILGLEGLCFVEQWPLSLKDEDEQIHQIFSFLKSFHIKHGILAWYEINKIASGTGAKDEGILGLSAFGKKVVKKMEKEGFIIDLSHVDDPSFWDVLEVVSGPVICSHSNARTLCNHPRNLSDEQLKAIASCGGLVGVNAHWAFIDPQNPTIHRFIDHIDHMAEQIGIEHIAFGFDFTNYIEMYNQAPGFRTAAGLDSVLCVPNLMKLLRERGYSEKELDAMAHTNFLKYLKKIWKKGGE
ncbi:MAG: membrane dipeptidase [Thermotaleaceae bacterium]